MIYNNIADPKVDAKLIADVQAGGAGFKRPKDFGYYLVFTDVNFIYDPDHSYASLLWPDRSGFCW
jgi:hypothetical protein